MSVKASNPGRTGAQVAAADPSQSVWVAANAGTGKTHVLIDRIARLLLAGTPSSRILCLTFTKAAAAEMANRLSKLLGAWAVAEDADLATNLQSLLGRAATPEQTAIARRLFAETLEVPEGLKIRTIHAFCESLLGRFPLEAGVAPHFSVLDERTAAELLMEARNRVLAGAFDGGPAELTAALDRLAGLVDEDGFATVVRELAARRNRLRAMIRRHGDLDGLISAIRRRLGLEAEENADTVIAWARTTRDEAALGRACEALDRGSGKDKERAAKIRAWLAGGGFEPYWSAFLTQKGEPQKNLITKKAQEADAGAIDALLAEQAHVHAVHRRLKAVAVAESTAALLQVGKGLLDAYEALKRARALLDYDDLILTARQLLEGGVSWVHYKLDGGLDHILVDEAQDTSPEQWDVIAALAQEFFAGEGGAEAARTVFAVGDEKQSIYSFQGAAPEAFETMRSHFEERARTARNNWQSVELGQSFRSTVAILSTVDKVFEQGRARDGLTSGDSIIRHVPWRTGQAGMVEVWPTAVPETTDMPDFWDAPLDQLPAESPQARVAERIAERIAGWLRDGEILQSAGRPVRPGDILILVRRRTQFVEEMVRCLKKRNVPVAGSDRMVLTEQIAVMDLVALGRFLLLPEDDLTLATVLKGPLFGLDDAALFDLAHGRSGTLWSALRRSERFTDTHARLAELLGRADFMPPYEFFSEVLGKGRGREALLARLGPDARDPIDEFLTLALDFERDHVPSLQGFLQWLEAGETQIKRDLEQGRGEVRVMTVHGAKGLQSEIVFLPDTCSTPDGRLAARILWGGDDTDPYLLWPARSENAEAECTRLSDIAKRRHDEEYRRLLYVAMTRARDRLYVCGWENKKGRAEGCWYDLIADVVMENENTEEIPLEFGVTGWRLSSPQSEPPEGRDDGSKPAAGEIVLPSWARETAPVDPEPPRPLAPSRPSGDEPTVRSPFDIDDGARFKRGRLIHRLLQGLPELPAETRAAAARDFLARPAHDLSQEARDELLGEVMAVLTDPDLAPLFAPGSRAEVPLIGEISGHVVSAQVDRLSITDESVTVIDFKTNRPSPVDENAVPELYLRQMAAYRALLARVYPDRPVRCLLLWTDGPRVMALADDRLDAHAP
jgi:ATP-dependent helicase/nuclease subunit A